MDRDKEKEREVINFAKQPGQRVLELGGGANRHPNSDVNVDVRQVQGVDFTVDFNAEKWPEISDNEFDIVYACFVLEHISWRMIPTFLKNTLAKLKPGGKAIFVIPNTEAQMKHCLSKTEFDEDGDVGSMIFGTLDYPENSHRAAFSPGSVTKKFTAAGFVNILTTPFGALATDMIVEAHKPGAPPTSEPVAPQVVTPPPPPSPPQIAPPVAQTSPSRPASEVFNHSYFEKYQEMSFYWDYPQNYILAQKVLERQPKSVLELGCARGYVLKRVQDTGIPGQGIDVSRHAWLTRVCQSIDLYDLTTLQWPVENQSFDLVYSFSLLEHLPESFLPAFVDELRRVGKRGLHGVTLEGLAPNHDPTRCTLRSIDFWKKILPEGHEVVDIRELSGGELPQDYVNGDGRTKLHLGSAWTMFHNGWTNIDIIDGDNFAKGYKYRFLRHDLRNGIPVATGVADCIFSAHCFEHLTYEELAKLLKECRRVIRPDGCMRIVIPDTETLTFDYHNKPGLASYDEMNDGCAKAPTFAGKLWALLGQGHSSFLDEETLFMMLEETGWVPHKAVFRVTTQPGIRRILNETTEMTYGGTSLFADATPKLGG